MIENMIVIAVVTGVALLALRSLYRTFSGRSSGCACSGKGCAEGGAGPEVGAHSCQCHKDGGCQSRTGQHLLSDIGRLPAGRLNSGTTAQSVLLEGLKSKLAVLREDKCRLEQEIENRPHPPQRTKGDQDDKNSIEERKTLLQRLQDLEGDLSALREENRRLQQALDEQREANTRSAREVRELLANMRAGAACDKSCPAYDLCKKRILIVGGITKMEALYRQLIEGSGGIFEYHDGYVKGGVRKLEVCMKRADMVLCPLDCNSHAACSLVKNLGKKYQKPVHILANSSMSAVMQALGGQTKPQIQGH